MTVAAISAAQGLHGTEESPRRRSESVVDAELRPHMPVVPFASVSSIPWDPVSKATTFGAMGKASPSQMFEPLVSDANERRRAAMKRDVEPDPRASVYQQRFDRKYADAPRAEAPATLRNGRESHPTEAPMPQEERPRMPSGAPNQQDTARNTMLEPDANPRATRATRDPFSPGTSRREMQAPPEGNHQANASSPRTPPVASAGPAGAVSAGGRVDGREAAQQVGRILAATRANAAETARTQPPGPAPTGDRPPPSNASATNRAGSSDQSGKRLGESRMGLIERGARTEFDKLVRSLRLQVGARQSSAKMHLDPPQLGRMFVDVRVKQGGIEINIRTETEQARALLDERAGQLRVALAQAGVHVDRFEVRADFAADRSPASAGGFDWSSGADLSGRSNPDVPRDGRNDGDVVHATVPPQWEGVVSVESEHDDTVLSGLERRLDLRI